MQRMIELLKILLSLSLSGTLLILVLILCKPLYRNRLSRQWQYYIWLVVVARLLLPFTPETSLVGNLFQSLDSAIVQISTSEQANSSLLPETDFSEDDLSSKNQANTTAKKSAELEKTLVQRVFETVTQNIWLICVLIWLMVAVGLLIRKVTIYQSFVKYINAGRVEVIDMRLWEQLGKLVEQAEIKRTVEVYTNNIISSPLLIGFLHPCIMLPSAELSDSDLENTILHELTHYKRWDMFYKWLIQITICFHWFNPFVYLMGREINRACEFSCDETIIRNFDKQAKRVYGDTLLNALKQGGQYKDSLTCVTLNENTEILKERLDAIMMFRRKSGFVICFTILLTTFLLCGFTYTGAYAIDNSQSTNETNNSDIVLESYSFFLIGGMTPAIKPTFKNNTSFEITEIAVDIDFLDRGGIVAYKVSRHTPVKSGESTSNSFLGLATGVDKIRLCIRSYTTREGKVYKIEDDKIFWYDLEVNLSTDSNSTDKKQLDTYKTILIDNSNMDNVLHFKSLKGYSYYAYGPYYAGKQGEGKNVLFNIKNGVDGSMLIATAKNEECLDGINNTLSMNSSYSGKMPIIVDEDGYYYVIIGAKKIKNLKGTIQIPIYE